MASLPNFVQFARKPSLLITWLDESGDPMDLTTATITAVLAIGPHYNAPFAATGTFTVTDATGGVFRWDLSEADVANYGNFKVQFTAAFSAGVTPAKTFRANWHIERSLVVVE